MNATLSSLATDMQTLAGQYIPQAYQLGKAKAQRKYGVIKPWGDRDSVNVELLLNRHAQELSKSMANAERAIAAGMPLAKTIANYIGRVRTWAWTLSPALASGLAAGVDQSRTEIGRAENLEPNDIGIIWMNAKDERVCKKCLYLSGRWFDAKQAYSIAATVHPHCRCPANWDVGTPDEAFVGPIPGYKPGTADMIYQDLGADPMIANRIRKARVGGRVRAHMPPLGKPIAI